MNDALAGKLITATVVLIAITMTAVSIYWDKEPPFFNVMDETIAASEQLERPVVVGSATTVTLMHTVKQMFEKRGGYLANDVLPPGLFMDNIPQWEYGVMLPVRDLTRVMNDRIGRSSKSSEDEDLAIAEVRFNSEHTSWVMPDAQSEYEEGIEHLGNYLERLSDVEDPEARFDASAENLDDWLGAVEVRMNSLSQRLIASVGQRRIEGVGADKNASEAAMGEDQLAVKTPWLQIDDVFYEARGSSWALVHLFKAIEIDFADVLKDRNAQVAVAQIIRELEATQQDIGSPMVLNGDAFGLLANHSLAIASYISRANAEIIELRKLLEKE
jgi:hypothetical protein